MKGMLISFEGGEGCGKSTQIKLFKQFLETLKLDYISAREPGGTVLGEEIRNLLLHSKGNISPQTEFLLFSASRSKLIEDIVKPALEEGKIVVLDRYFDSSYAYQGYAGNLAVPDLKQITNFAINGAVPDLTILLDLSYEEGVKRKSKDANLKDFDRIERKGKSFHDNVRKGYLLLAEENVDRISVLDASKSQNEIAQNIQQIFLKKYADLQK